MYVNAYNTNTHYYDKTNIQTKTDTNKHDMMQHFLDTPDKCKDMQATHACVNHMQRKYADVFQGLMFLQGYCIYRN